MSDTQRPAAPTMARPTKPRSRIRLGWLLASLAMFLLVVVLVLFALTRASDRTAVLTIATPVEAGDPIPSSAITVTQVSGDALNMSRIYRSNQQDAIVDSIALVDLEPGDLLGPSVLTAAPAELDGEQLVGAVLRAGRYPAEIQRGDVALAVPTFTATEEPPSIVISVRVLRVSVSETDELSVTLAVSDDEADRVANWAAQDSLALATTPIGGDQ